MIKKTLFLIVFALLFVNCQKTSKKRTYIKLKSAIPNTKTDDNTNVSYEKAITKSTKFAKNLNFDLDYIRKKGFPDKKYLSEFLGLYLKLFKASKIEKEKSELKKRLQPFYEKTLKPEFHNMSTVNDKLFKKNSMSYMRILWLLQQMKFDTKFYENELKKVQKRMDNHMSIRGEWQRAVFDKYYDYFKIKKPVDLKKAKLLKGPISKRQPIDFYDKTNAYILTHFLFAAYDYGNKKTQKRFNEGDIKYLKSILPQIINKFELKKNDDIVAELLTCLVFIGDTNTKFFKKSYTRLINNQNKNGSFGDYERYRKKIGSDIDFRAYLHTTLVAVETLVEFEYRK